MTDLEDVERARRALGKQLALLRKAVGYSQHQLAPLTSYGRSTIANVEVGRQRVPRAFWETCDRVLHTNGLLAAEYDQVQRLEARARYSTAQALSVSSDLALPTEQSELDPDSAAPACDGGLPLPGLLSALTAGRLPAVDACGNPGEAIEMSPEEAAELLLQRCLRLDDEQGGDRLYGTLSTIVSGMASVVEDQGVGLATLAQLAQMTGWLALDSSRHGPARRFFNTAVYAAHEADEPALAASALAYMSLQDTYRGRPRSALSLARTAVEVSNGSVSRLTKTMLATRLARAQASVRDKRNSLATLRVARQTFTRTEIEAEPLWVSYVDDIELSAQEGACYLELRMPKEAAQALGHALDLQQQWAPHRVRDRVHYLSRVAKCRLLDYDVEEACDTAHEALQTAANLNSPRVIDRLGEFRDSLQPFTKNRAAREFCEAFDEMQWVTAAGEHRPRPGRE
jgi:transcriptional regulator with XRE-family HTH domain